MKKLITLTILILTLISIATAIPDTNTINDRTKIYFPFSDTGLVASKGSVNLTNVNNSVSFSSTDGIKGQYANFTDQSLLTFVPQYDDELQGITSLTIGFSIKTSCPNETMYLLSRGYNGIVGEQNVIIKTTCDSNPPYDCGKLKYYARTTGQPLIVSTNYDVCDDTWHNVIINKNVATQNTKIYIDGIDQTDTSNGAYNNPEVAGGDYRLGWSDYYVSGNPTTYTYQGLIDEFFIINGSITNDDVLFLNSTNQTYPFCYPNYYCSYYDSCQANNNMPCLNVTDQNTCNNEYSTPQNNSDYDMYCNYARSLIIYNDTSLPVIVVDGSVKLVRGFGTMAFLIALALILVILTFITGQKMPVDIKSKR